MSYFDLAIEGLARLRRTTPFGEQPISWEPLSGLVDGSNTRFRSRKSPIKPNSLTAYVSGSVVVATLTSPDLVTLASAPAAQPYASYVYQPLSDLRGKQLLMDGIYELERRWPRGWRLSSVTSSFTAATEADSHIYVLRSDALTDPSDEVALSTSENQRALVLSCATYVYRMAQAWAASLAAVSIRGTGGGMTLDRRAIPTAMMNMLAMYDKRLQSQLIQGMMEWTGGDSLGGGLSPIATRDYMEQWEWQTASILEDWYGNYRYDPSDVDLEAIA